MGGQLNRAPRKNEDQQSPEEVRRELDELALALAKMMDDFQTWNISVGPAKIQLPVTSMAFATVFVLLNVGLGITGAVLIAFKDPARTIGISIMVGAIFAFGTFLTEVWSKSVEKEQKIFELVGGHRMSDILGRLEARYVELATGTGEVDETNPFIAMQAAWAAKVASRKRAERNRPRIRVSARKLMTKVGSVSNRVLRSLGIRRRKAAPNEK